MLDQSKLKSDIKKALEAGEKGSQDAIADGIAKAVIDAIKSGDVKINLSSQKPPIVANDKSPLSGTLKGTIS